MESSLPFSHIITSQYIIGNTRVTAAKDNTIVLDKYTQSQLASIPLADHALINEAIEYAQIGFQYMRKTSAGERRIMLQRMAEILRDEKEPFAQLITAEAGKPISYARAEVDRCITTLILAAEECIRHSGETVPIDFDGGTGKTAFTKRFPLGPIACISPFNFPLNLALHKIAPALATGCSVLLKPAPQSPLSVLAFAKLVHEKGILPQGSLQVFLADNETTEKIVTDNRLKLFSFTGSPQVGWMLKSKASKKRVILELGGNAPVIIDASADLLHAAKRCAIGSFLYSGQICIATQRIYVHNAAYEAFLSFFLAEVKKIKAGDPKDESVSVGPIIESKHVERISDWIKEAEQGGAKILAGGQILGAYKNVISPTVLTNTTEAMKVCNQEVFGPVVLVEPVSTFEEGIQKSNQSSFGLQAGVFTEQIEHLKQAHEQLEVGGVIINDIPGFRIDSMPYGGIKDSGLGREGIKYAMDDMTEPKLLIY